MLQTKLILPSAHLRSLVHHYWVMKADRISMEMNIIPTGCMKWMFHRGVPFVVNGIDNASHVATICGQYNRGVFVRTKNYSDLIFVFFRPYALKAILGIPCDLFMEDNIDMDSVSIPEMHDLKRMVLDAPDNATAIGIIEKFISRRLADCYDALTLKRMTAVCDIIDSNPNVGVSALSDAACLSERQFRRIFIENVGMTPKQMIRTKRMYYATKLIQNLDECDLSDIVDRLGFTDHSHFNKEFKIFAGMSPTNYLAHIKAIKSSNFLGGYKAYHE